MFQYNTIEEALEDLRQGKMILCTDDPDRENEGDLICAAEFATTENVNFMATHGKGLICMPMSYGYVQKLQFPQMVTRNTDNHETAFTVSIEAAEGVTTGISAADRARTAAPPSPEAASTASEDDLLGHISFDPIVLDALAARTGLDAAHLQARLLTLELDGHIVRLPGALFQRFVGA